MQALAMENKRIAFHNLGCKVNGYETESMLRQMEAEGYQIVAFEPGADIYVINTCTVTNLADRKSRQMLHRAKAMNPQALVVAVGCYAQVAGAKLQEDDAVDLIIGNDEKSRLPERIRDYFKGCGGRFFVENIGESRSFEELPLGGGGAKSRAFLKIEDGCNQFCSYCLIPYARGRVRSRAPEKTLAEARRLAAAGYGEIVLTGIHLASYGLDFEGDAGEEAGYGGPLLALLSRLNEIEGIRRIRLGSLEPRLITRDYAQALSRIEKLCPHFHLSLQSGSDGVLKRMNRKYTAQAFLEEMEALREAFERPALTTDVIVGFPGETEEEFEETLRFLEEADFYQTHVFRYSRRSGTAADKMPDQVPEGVKAARSARLLSLSRQRQQAFEAGLIGSERSILLEEPLEGDWWLGRSPEYVKLKIRVADPAPGRLVSCRIQAENLLKGGERDAGED